MANLLNSNQLRNGTVYVDGRDVLSVIRYQHIKHGRGQAVIRVKVRNILSGVISEKTYDPNLRLEEAEVSKRSAQMLYVDDSQAYFMDNDSYEQFSLQIDQIIDSLKYMNEGQKVVAMFLDGKPVSIELPKSVELEVTDAVDAVAGDSATSANKKVVLSTGLEVDVPLFVKKGDILKINTDTGEYVSRV